MNVDVELSHEPKIWPFPQCIPTQTTSGHQWQFPQQYCNFLPNSMTQVPHLPEQIIARLLSPLSAKPRSLSPEVPKPQPQGITMKPDEFGLFCVYETYPSLVPDENQGLDDCCDAPGLSGAPSANTQQWWTGFGHRIPDLSSQALHQNIFVPFLNTMVFCLMNWFYSRSNMKSVTELQSLVDKFS